MCSIKKKNYLTCLKSYSFHKGVFTKLNVIVSNKFNNRILWPTIDQVRTSYEGYIAGGSLRLSSKNNKPLLRDFLYKLQLDAIHPSRARAMPHSKVSIVNLC